ncbi:MAG: hypothetical protein LBU04_06240 [Christensenellaceae bacterium]|jgi:hypothetical protein|nr:hypothetical protein [Christensenellaceae bacterium]
MAKKQLTKHDQFNARWTERDEAIFIDLLKRKIGELKFEIHKATSPYIRARLKTRRNEYKSILAKVETGVYNGDLLAMQMSAYQHAKSQETAKYDMKIGKVGKYVDAYEDISFDFDTYFRSSRYFGSSLPIISLILMILFTAILLFSLVFPVDTVKDLEGRISTVLEEYEAPRLMPSTIIYYKLSEERDFLYINDGKWPEGTYAQDALVAEYGTPYTVNGVVPEAVYLYKDLKMTSVNITGADVAKAVFFTPLLQKYKVDLIENVLLQDPKTVDSWYYRLFISNRSESLKIQRDENGKWSATNIINNLATYAVIVFFFLAIICCVLEIIFTVMRMFSYTSRRLHIIPILLLISLVMLVICPIFAVIPGLDNATLTAEFKSYFTLTWNTFIEDTGTGSLGANFLLLATAGLILIYLLLPRLFKNKAFKTPTFVPKGNRPHPSTTAIKQKRNYAPAPVAAKSGAMQIMPQRPLRPQ